MDHCYIKALLRDDGTRQQGRKAERDDDGTGDDGGYRCQVSGVRDEDDGTDDDGTRQ